MKNILILCFICFILFSCKTQVDTLKTQISQNYPSIPSFQGTILGNNVIYHDKIDSWRSATNLHNKFTFEGINVVPIFINLNMMFERVQNDGLNSKHFMIVFPSITTLKEMNDIELIRKNTLALGKKEMMYLPNRVVPSPHKGFALYYTDYSLAKPFYGDTKWGVQNEDALEIVSVKELPPADSRFTATFIITFRVNSKLYSEGSKYGGDLKGLLTCRWDYAPE